MSGRWLLAVPLFAACSHPPPPPSSGPATTTTTTANATAACRPRQVTVCPSTPEGECDGKSALCTFADKECHCGYAFVGGAPPRGPMTWQCAVAVRPDGCPGLSPAAGECCSAPDHDCSYPAGNNGQYIGACRHGAWVDVTRPRAMP